MKPFNCPSCGPIDHSLVFGDWISDDYKGVQFNVMRVDTFECSASISEGSKHLIEGVMESAKACAAVEDYCGEEKKMQCPTCGTHFKLRKPAPPPPPQTAMSNNQLLQQFQQAIGAGQTSPSSFGPQWSQTVETMFDSKFTDTELDDIIRELGEDPNNFPAKSDKLSFVLATLFG